VYLPTFPQGDAADGGWAVALEVARWADEAGVGTVWIADHLFWGQPCLESLTVAAAVAVTTQHVAIGTGVLQAPLRSTAALAKAAASIQDLSGGRLLLGMGVGSHEVEYQRTGQAPFARRGEVLDEQLEALAALWSSAGGDYPQQPLPGVPIPRWFGGSGPHVRRRVVTHGSGWTSAFLRPKALGEEAGCLRDELGAAGRDPADVSVAAIVPVFTTGPGQEVDVSVPLDHLHGMYGIDRRLFLGHLAAGEPEACVEKALRFRDVGADHLALVVPADDPRPHLEALLPLLQQSTGDGLTRGGHA
jgi:alkanesulfonate monooxygenase SsuD/methylene tetrahydromethanopterin reductase-like flavin-dependent oxidoreductase (luciferase family)